jgi:MFS family permease
MGGLVWKAAAYRFLDTFILIFPFYTVMFAENGLSPAQIGVCLAAWSLSALSLEIPTGALADRMSRRWLLFAAQLFRGAGFALWVIFPGFWGFLAGLVMWGVKSALVSGTFEALLFDELKAAGREQEYARAIGRAQTGRFAGLMIAALMAAALAWAGYAALTWASSALSLLAAASALLLPRAPKAARAGRADYLAKMKSGVAEAVRRPGVLPILLFIAAMSALLAACEDYWQIFGREVGLPSAGIALFVAALGAGAAIASSLAHRAPLSHPAALHGLVAVAGLLLTLAAVTFQTWSVGLAVLFTSLCQMANVRADARFQHALSGEARATVASVKGFASQCAIALLILNFGLLAEVSAYRWAFLIHGVALALLGAGYAAASWRRPSRRQAPG